MGEVLQFLLQQKRGIPIFVTTEKGFLTLCYNQKDYLFVTTKGDTFFCYNKRRYFSFTTEKWNTSLVTTIRDTPLLQQKNGYLSLLQQKRGYLSVTTENGIHFFVTTEMGYLSVTTENGIPFCYNRKGIPIFDTTEKWDTSLFG